MPATKIETRCGVFLGAPQFVAALFCISIFTARVIPAKAGIQHSSPPFAPSRLRVKFFSHPRNPRNPRKSFCPPRPRAKKRALILIPLFILSLSSPALADGPPATVTIETNQGAIFISGPKDKATAVRNDLSTLGAAEWPLEKIVGYITEKFPGQLDAQVFRKSDIATLEDAENLELPLRRAILIGLLPPIEGLTENEALKVLQAAGISAFLQPEWTAMPQRDKAAKLTASSGQVAILKSSAPQDTVTIIFVNTEKKNGNN